MASKYIGQITRAYDLLARETEERAVCKIPFARDLVAEFASQITSGRLIYDLGCGVGLATRAFLDLGFHVIGIDVSAESLAYARQRNPEARFIQEDFLDFKCDQQADGIFANAFIHLFTESDAKLVLDKIHGLLKQEGL